MANGDKSSDSRAKLAPQRIQLNEPYQAEKGTEPRVLFIAGEHFETADIDAHPRGILMVDKGGGRHLLPWQRVRGVACK